MSFERQPESLHTLYAELLDQKVRSAAEAAALALPAGGSFVSKNVRGKTYWYLQQLAAGHKRQLYLGPASPSLLAWIEEVKGHRSATAQDEERHAELVSMLAAGGAPRVGGAVAAVLQSLAEIGVFRLGGVLVGTQAFIGYQNMLGVRFEQAWVRTEDIDVAQDPDISLALDPEAIPESVERALVQADPKFFAIPTLDPRQPSTAFKVRGRDLRVDFLTPAKGRGARSHGNDQPVPLRLFEIAAYPLDFLDYLIEDSQQAVVLGGRGILVNVPQPGRFALHKIWTAGRRPATEQAKARKDRSQAAALLEVLLEDRVGDVQEAWRPLRGRSRGKAIRQGCEGLAEPLAGRLTALLS